MSLVLALRRQRQEDEFQDSQGFIARVNKAKQTKTSPKQWWQQKHLQPLRALGTVIAVSAHSPGQQFYTHYGCLQDVVPQDVSFKYRTQTVCYSPFKAIWVSHLTTPLDLRPTYAVTLNSLSVTSHGNSLLLSTHSISLRPCVQSKPVSLFKGSCAVWQWESISGFQTGWHTLQHGILGILFIRVPFNLCFLPRKLLKVTVLPLQTKR